MGKTFTNDVLNCGKMLHFPVKLKAWSFIKPFIMNTLQESIHIRS